MNPLSTFLAARYGRPYSPQRLARAQARGLAHLRQKVMVKSPFYAPFAQEDMAQWPIIAKPQMMAHFDEINTLGITREAALEIAQRAEISRDFSPMIGKIAVGLSTGTSGQRGIFLSSPRERALWAALMLGRFTPSFLARQRVAFFLRANNRLYESLNNPLISFEFYDLLRPFEEHCAKITQQSPSVLIAPAQVLAALARAQLAGEIAIAPEVVISVAEVATPEDETLVARAFSRPLDQVYQCTEGVLGMTCAMGSLHLNEDFLIIEREVIDSQSGAFIPIITDLARQSQPIIRYRLDDVLVPHPNPCRCGCARQRLLRIEGRADDMLYWPRHSGGKRMVPADALRQAVALAKTPIREYRAEQSGGALHIALDCSDLETASQEISANLAAMARSFDVSLPQLHFTQEHNIDFGAKRRRVINRESEARI